ncbi:MAG: hypothetical protein LBC26_03090 [Oscillospiraceae bacterium]|jgi:ABC-2 type transport system permease protein|nr:hypothetical protein [Oscillospiraceae bacterium]
MKKSLFPTGLYLDFLRQLRIVGGILLALILLITVLLPVGGALTSERRDTPNILVLTPALIPFMYLGTIVLVFAAFSFLFSRRASDFYHALPETRLSLYGAAAGAALTWVLGTVTLAALAAHAVYGLCGFEPALSDLLPNLLGYALGSLLVAGCVLVGVCATGTRFSAFVLTMILLFLPRYVSVLLNVTMENVAPMLIPGHMGPLFDVSLNFPVSFFLSAFDVNFGRAVGGVQALFYAASTLLYTGVLAACYIGAAGAIFHGRTSETAARSAPGPVLQRVYSGLVTTPGLFLLGVVTVLCTFMGYSKDMGIVMIVLVLLTVTLYGVYMLITTKRLRSLKQGLLVLPATAAVCFALLFGVAAVCRTEMAAVPEASEIAGVQEHLSAAHWGVVSYGMLRRSEVVLADPELRALVAKGLATTRDAGGQSPGPSIRLMMDVTLESGRVVNRQFYIREQDGERAQRLIDSDPNYMAAAGAFPEDGEIKSVGFGGNIYRGGVNFSVLSKTVGREIVRVFREELQALPPATRVALAHVSNMPYIRISTASSAAPSDEAAPGATGLMVSGVPLYRTEDGVATLGITLVVRGVRGGVPFQSFYQLSGHTPRAANLLMAAINGMTDVSVRARMAQQVAAGASPEHLMLSGDLTLENIPYKAGWYRSDSLNYNWDKTAENAVGLALAARLLAATADAPDITKPLVSYSLYVVPIGEKTIEEAIQLHLYANIEESDVEALLEMAGAAIPPDQFPPDRFPPDLFPPS